MRRSRPTSPAGGSCPPCPPVGGSGAGASKGSCSPGKMTRNPYLNFLRDFRQRNCGLSAVEVVRQGARAWNALSAEQRVPYVKQACAHPQRKSVCPTPANGGGRARSSSRDEAGGRSPRGRSVRRSAVSTAAAAGGRMRRSASRGGSKGRRTGR